MTARVRTACSERRVSWSSGFCSVEVTCGGIGSDGAWRARSCRSSSRMDGRSGWLLARGDGGAVIRRTVLKASLNWRLDKFWGNTYQGCECLVWE